MKFLIKILDFIFKNDCRQSILKFSYYSKDDYKYPKHVTICTFLSSISKYFILNANLNIHVLVSVFCVLYVFRA
jgi:hypothetical protein